MVSVLFLAPDDLGETVLATGALAYAVRGGGSVTVACSAEAAPLFRALPELVATHVIGKGSAERLGVAAKLMGQRYDLQIDARGGFLGRATSASRRVSLKPGSLVRHRTEDWAAAMGAEKALAPVMWLDEGARQQAAAIASDDALLLVLAPGGASFGKRWPVDRFAAVARRLVGSALANARVIALGAAARDAETTRAIVSSLDADGVSASDAGSDFDLLGAAALLERATLCIGNDNALTHIAAAVNASTLTLFGPTDERVRAPYGPRTRTVRGRSFEAAAGGSVLDAAAAMEDVSIDAVEAAALELLHAGGLR